MDMYVLNLNYIVLIRSAILYVCNFMRVFGASGTLNNQFFHKTLLKKLAFCRLIWQ